MESLAFGDYQDILRRTAVDKVSPIKLSIMLKINILLVKKDQSL